MTDTAGTPNDETAQSDGGSVAELPRTAPFLVADLAARITFATHQAAVPMVRSLRIHNPEDCPTREALRIELTCEPPVVLPQTWHITRVRPADEVSVMSRNVKLDGGMLDRLSERIRADVTMRLLDGDTVVDEFSHEVIALARNEWGGAESMPELLAAFVSPNDQAVSTVIAEASDLLKASGRPHSLEGYQAKNRERPWEIAAAIWTAVANRRLIYAEPPASFERAGQKVRSTADVLETRLATCLDLAALFAAALEQCGLHPIICLVEGHALVGVWLRDATLPELITDDASLLRRYIGLDDLILFETTLVCQDPPAQFRQAIETGRRHIREEMEGKFVYALDIKQARGRGIHPLPLLVDPLRTSAETSVRTADLTLEAAPPLRPLDEVVPGSKPTTAEGRIENWKRRLLDLTKRNRLLNLKPTKAAIRLVCPDLGAVEDKLAADEKLTIIHLEQLPGSEAGRDAEVFVQQNKTDYAELFARQALERNQLVAKLPKPELMSGLLELYRKAASDLREGGANTLYLAIGTLRWRQSEEDKTPMFRAPILLVPVTLVRKSAAASLQLVKHADETVVNMTLLEMLHQDFGIDIPDLRGPLPIDDSGVDVKRVLRLVEQAIGDARKWSVENEVVLSTFSFAKYLMWKDLCDQAEHLKRSRFVKHMIESPHKAYDGNAEFVEPKELDDRVDPKDLFLPTPADSSQIAAVYASGGGGDMVLEGPPGTGKSQTIANIIAHNLALGRRVLFVAEKMTALSVVHDRLAKIGLGDFCLELHSSKATRRAVVDQLSRAWSKRTELAATDWVQEAERLKDVRQKLNGLVKALHEPAPSGISPRKAIATVCASEVSELLTLDWPSSLSADRITSPALLEHFELVAEQLGDSYRAISPEDRAAFGAIRHTDWSNQWSADAVSAAAALDENLRRVRDLGVRVAATLKLPNALVTMPSFEALANLASALVSAPSAEVVGFLGADGEDKARLIEEGCLALLRYREAHAALPHAVSHEIVRSADHDALGAQWRLASQAFVIARFFRQRAARRQAETTWRVSGVDDVGAVVNAMISAKKLQDDVLSFEGQLALDSGWRGLESDPARLRGVIESGRRLRAATIRLGDTPESLAAVRQAIAGFVRDGFELLEAGAPTGALLRQFSEAQVAASEACRRFVELMRFQSPEAESLEQLQATAKGIVTRAPRLNAWCHWQRAAEEAASAGLGAIASALENDAIRPERVVEAFRVAYCRWLAPLLIDSRPALVQFSATSHERLIARFRELDERLAKLAAEEIRVRLSQNIAHPQQLDQEPGYSVLKREAQAQRSPRTVRTVLTEMGPVVGKLMPCFMMSPMSVAQFIPVDAMPFDLVIFDEASQITTWDAIGTIARGRQVIIVGDPKQMPPTNFFGRSADDEESAEEEGADAIVSDLESILDEALAAGLKHHRLTGHYRSRHESLIAFSNHSYYGGELVTYPPAETKASAVSLVRVNGTYQKGKDRTNPTEAKAVVAEVSRRLRDPTLQNQSIGIVTMNSEQQRLIRDLLDDERRRYPDIELAFKRDDGEERDMVYNLETVQGHERDVILISVGYGPSEPGAPTMSMNFGPLNRTGGERRLNVAVTRAAQEVVVFASFDPGMIDLSRTKARAVEDLKLYLDYAERGPSALMQATRDGSGVDQFDSPFEEAVARALRARGWEVRTQVGVSRFRVDLGIVHPDLPGRYLAGVECDGARYHGSATARDRDRIREGVLTTLGWSLIRLWSTDYFLEPIASLDRIHARLVELYEADRCRPNPMPPAEVAPISSEADVAEDVTKAEPELAATSATAAPRFASMAVPSMTQGVAVEDEEEEVGEAEALGGASADMQLYDDAYLPSLRQQCFELIDRVGPMTMDYLAERVARAHGFARTGSRIRDRVTKAVGRGRTAAKDLSGVRVVWPAGMMPVDTMPFRGLDIEGGHRSWDDVPHCERLGLAAVMLKQFGRSGAIAAMATVLGFSRLKEKRRIEFVALLAAVPTDGS